MARRGTFHWPNATVVTLSLLRHEASGLKLHIVAASKKPTKSRGLPAHLVPGNPGNSGGKKGRSGRRPESFAAFIRALHGDKAVREAIEDAAQDSASKGFSAVLKLMAEYDPERPAPPKQELTGELVVRVVRD